MKILKWNPDFYPCVESPVVPVWIGLPGLPLHFFEKSALFCIASVIGNPLKIDEPTAKLSRPSVARICIEVDVSKALNRRIWLGDDKDGYWQDIVFEDPPHYCDFCKMLGHDHSTCFKKNPELFKEQKKDSVNEKSKDEKIISSEVPMDSVEKENQKGAWRRKDTDTAADEPKAAEEWIVVGGKKKHNSLSSTLNKKTERSMAVTQSSKILSTVISTKKLEETEIKESSLHSEIPMAKSVDEGPPIISIEAVGVLVPTISIPSFKPPETLQMAIALTPFPDIARIRKKMGIGNEANPVCAQDRKMTHPSSKVKSETSISKSIEIQPLDISAVYSDMDERLVESEKLKSNVQKVVGGTSAEPSDQNGSNGLHLFSSLDQSHGDNNEGQLELVPALFQEKDKSAAPVREAAVNKIPPLDRAIVAQPSIVGGHGLKSGDTKMGGLMGLERSPSRNSPKGFGNLGFEFFKGPNQGCGLDQNQQDHSAAAGSFSAGLFSGRGPEQNKEQMGGIQLSGQKSCIGLDHAGLGSPLAAAPQLNIAKLGSGLCQLNQMDSPPSNQFNFQPNNLQSEIVSSHEEGNSSESEASDYFDYYHSDGNFPDESDWYSENSESAKFLKGKWRRGYNLRASSSRRSIGPPSALLLQGPPAALPGVTLQVPEVANPAGLCQPNTEAPPSLVPLSNSKQQPWNPKAPTFANVLQGQHSHPQTSPRTHKKSFASMFSSTSEVQIITPSIHRGKLAVMFSDEDISKLATYYKFAMVGKFSRKAPEFKAIKPGLTKLGFRGDFTVGALRPGYILLNFQLEEDYTRLWLKPEWQVAGWPMRVFKWTPSFTYEAESSLAAVWVALPDLPPHFFSKSALFSIASLIGKPLKLNEPTADRTRPSVARVCVEIDLLKEHDQELWVGCGFPLKFVFENKPAYCQNCWRRGHDITYCHHGQLQEKWKGKEILQSGTGNEHVTDHQNGNEVAGPSKRNEEDQTQKLQKTGVFAQLGNFGRHEFQARNRKNETKDSDRSSRLETENRKSFPGNGEKRTAENDELQKKKRTGRWAGSFLCHLSETGQAAVNISSM